MLLRFVLLFYFARATPLMNSLSEPTDILQYGDITGRSPFCTKNVSRALFKGVCSAKYEDWYYYMMSDVYEALKVYWVPEVQTRVNTTVTPLIMSSIDNVKKELENVYENYSREIKAIDDMFTEYIPGVHKRIDETVIEDYTERFIVLDNFTYKWNSTIATWANDGKILKEFQKNTPTNFESVSDLLIGLGKLGEVIKDIHGTIMAIRTDLDDI